MTITPEYLSFAPLSEAAADEFADVRNFVARVASDLLGVSTLTQTESDLPVLQALADHEAMKHANYEAWVAVGIAFGDVLANCIPGLKWRLVTDQTGTYAALQFETKALSIAAPTMLWKRVERGEEFDLVHMAQELKSFVEGNAGEYGEA
jgi:hypothetical protein